MDRCKIMPAITRAAAYSSIAVCALLVWTYTLRPDWATALTIFPAWAWLVFSAFSFVRIRNHLGQIGLASWIVFAVLHIEEPRSLLRSFLPVKTEHSIRIATVNSTGSFQAIIDALDESPDILLIQESPSPSEWATFMEAYPSYELLRGIDASILVKGSIQTHDQAQFYTIGRVNIRGTIFGVGSLRLATSDPRIDLWNPSCWFSQTAMRKKQLSQIAQIETNLPESIPLILGGDFNVPQGDKIFRILEERFNDSFDGAARGWGNTIIADLPLLRIDQIWTTRELKSVNAYTKKSAHTDHRIYMVDFRLQTH
jgi:hypothetical protein